MYTSPDNLKLNDNIGLTVYSTVANRASLKGKVLGRVTVHAMRPGNAAATDHVNNFRNLPDELKLKYPTYDSYEYLMLQLNDGTQVYVGLPWIVEGSLYLEDSRRINIVLGNFRDPSHERIIALLRENGYEVESSTDLN